MASRTAFHEVKELEAAIARTREEQARLLADTLARRRACVHGDRSACLALPCDCTHRLWLQMRCEDLHDREACAASRQP